MGEADASQVVKCDEIVVRLLTAVRHFENNGDVSSEAFLLRENEDSLSLFRLSLLSPNECKTKLSRVRGLATLHVGRVRDLGRKMDRALDVIADEETGGPGHASLTGLQERSVDKLFAERIASMLRNQSRRLE